MSHDRFLLIRLSALGDVVNTLPTLALLRRARPEATIGFAVEDRTAALLEGHPLLDHLHVFPRRRWRDMARQPLRWVRLASEFRAYSAQIREVGYEVAIDVQGNLKGTLHSLLCGASQRIGYARGYDREFNHWFSTTSVVPPTDRPHRVDKFVSLLEPLGIAESQREWVFPNTHDGQALIDRFLQDRGIHPGEPILLHPGTSISGSDKRWPPEHFATLGRRIVGEFSRPVIVTWGPAERELARSMGDEAERVFVAPPTPSLLELLALLRAGRMLVSADTGPMHLAAAAGVGCIALFGPKSPAVYGPYGSGHGVVYRPEGMDRITVEDVMTAIRKILFGP